MTFLRLFSHFKQNCFYPIRAFRLELDNHLDNFNFLPTSPLQCYKVISEILKKIEGLWSQPLLISQVILDQLLTYFDTRWQINTTLQLFWGLIPLMINRHISFFMFNKCAMNLLIFCCSLTCWKRSSMGRYWESFKIWFILILIINIYLVTGNIKFLKLYLRREFAILKLLWFSSKKLLFMQNITLYLKIEWFKIIKKIKRLFHIFKCHIVYQIQPRIQRVFEKWRFSRESVDSVRKRVQK